MVPLGIRAPAAGGPWAQPETEMGKEGWAESNARRGKQREQCEVFGPGGGLISEDDAQTRACPSGDGPRDAVQPEGSVTP
jgi:hypothetical protein